MIINNHEVEFFEDEHIYLVDGIIVPSITQMMKLRFGRKYEGINQEVLDRAAEAGTRVHEAIEKLTTTGEREDLPEVRGFEFLKKHYKFEVNASERPVLLIIDGEPIAAGRFDLQLEMNGKIGGADIKRTSALDKEYLALQLNLYRIANRQTYDIEWEFLAGIHLRETTRKFVDIPINEQLTNEFIEEYRRTL